MKKTFSFNTAAKRIQVLSAKLENSNVLNFVERPKSDECCGWCVGIIGNANVQKSLILR